VSNTAASRTARSVVLSIKDRSVSYWFNVGDTVKVVSTDVLKGGMNLWICIGKVVETWGKCDVDPTCCCAEQVDPNLAVRVEFIGSLTTADDDDVCRI
jgi:hypothetical protein